MAYGISILDSNGKTIFDSNNYCELIAYKSTVVDGAWLDIPGWCYGQDQDVGSTFYTHTPSIYARPLSSSYAGDFCMQVDSGGSVSGDRYNRRVRILDKASGSNTFEVVVAMPAKDWGGIAGSKAHQSGSSSYGCEAYSAGGQKFHVDSTAGQFVTYSSLGRPSKVLLAKGVDHGSNSVSTTSLGSLTTSTTKRYCRMTGTQYGHIEYVSGVSSEYRQHYSWASNNSVGLKWTTIATATAPAHAFYSGRATIVLDNYDGKQLFAIADFGLGM